MNFYDIFFLGEFVHEIIPLNLVGWFNRSKVVQ